MKRKDLMNLDDLKSATRKLGFCLLTLTIQDFTLGPYSPKGSRPIVQASRSQSRKIYMPPFRLERQLRSLPRIHCIPREKASRVVLIAAGTRLRPGSCELEMAGTAVCHLDPLGASENLHHCGCTFSSARTARIKALLTSCMFPPGVDTSSSQLR